MGPIDAGVQYDHTKLAKASTEIARWVMVDKRILPLGVYIDWRNLMLQKCLQIGL